MKNLFKLCLCCWYDKTEKTQPTLNNNNNNNINNNNNNNNIHITCTFDDAILSHTVDTSSYDSRFDSIYDSSYRSSLST